LGESNVTCGDNPGVIEKICVWMSSFAVPLKLYAGGNPLASILPVTATPYSNNPPCAHATPEPIASVINTAINANREIIR
jgi:hypothetical protein